MRITIEHYINAGMINEWIFKFLNEKQLKASMERSMDKLKDLVESMPDPEPSLSEPWPQ